MAGHPTNLRCSTAVTLTTLCVAFACGETTTPTNTPPAIGTLRVSTSTTGSDIDVDGYTLSLDTLSPRTIPPNGPPEDFHLSPGTFTVHLDDLAPNCHLLPGIDSTFVSADSVSMVSLAVDCTALPGKVHVSVSTGGEDPDPDGFRVLVDGVFWKRTLPGGVAVLDTVPSGRRLITLEDVATNCKMIGDSTAIVDVGVSADAAAAFLVACERAPKVAFIDRSFVLRTMNDDGSGAITLSPPWLQALDPDWNPTGHRLAFSDLYRGIWVMNADGSQLAPLPLGGAGAYDPAWAPDDIHLAFSRVTTVGFAAIYSCELTGGDLRQLTTGSFRDYGAAWSPDGTRLVFVREFLDSRRQLFLVDPDGGNLVQLTDGLDDREPAWAPDGALIVFTGQGPTGERRLYLVRPDGSGRESVLPVDQRTWGYSPDWSADGSKILASEGGYLYFIDLTTRQELWTIAVGTPGVGSQMISWRR